jgi:acyl carrier protein
MKGDAINMLFLPPTITFELIENLFINQQQQKSYSISIIFALNWSIVHSKLDHLQSILLEDLIKRKYVQLELEHKDENQEFKTSINTMTIETIISKICSAVGEIFRSSNIDRIDINKSLNQQGMDSLMAVALRNWLEKELLISIPLSELFQGITIQYLSQTILTKLNEGLTTSEPLTTAIDENKIIIITATTEVNGDQIQTNDMINNKDDEYTNLSLMHCLYQEKIIINNSSSHKLILFDFINDSTADSSRITDQITERIKNQFSSIYLFQHPDNNLSPQLIETLVEEYIQQIRRRQLFICL